MKKIVLAIALLGIGTSAAWAQPYMTRTAKISFNATAPKSPEKIEAINNEVAAIADSKTGSIVFSAPIKSFKFERELMQQHFNENYMESDKYPKADFKGKIDNLSAVDFSKDGTYNVTVTGMLSMHGVAKEVKTPGTITVKGKEVTAKANIKLKLSDYKINIPSIASDKLSNDAAIKIDAIMNQK